MQFDETQMAQLDAHSDAAFVTRLIAHLRETQTVWVASWSEAVMQQRVASGIARARSHGFTWESSIARFVTLMARFGPGFDRCAPMRALLARRDVDGEHRAWLLFTDISAAQWQAAQAQYDPLAWFEFAAA